MAMITNALLQALRTELRREFSTAYEKMRANSFYRDVAMIVPSTTQSNTYDWLGDFPELIEWVGDRVIKDMKENGYQITNRTFEGTVGIGRSHIEDDNVGTSAARVRRMAQSAAEHPDRLIAELLKNGQAALCFDGQNFFDTDHPVAANHDGTGAVTTWSNYDDNGGVTTTPAWYLLDARTEAKGLIFQERTRPEFESKENPGSSDHVFIKDQYLYGVRYRCNAGYGFPHLAYKSHAALDGDSLDAAIAGMMSLTGDGGRPLGITPTHLVVPPQLRAAANQTVKVMLTTGGASNANYEAVEVIVTPWLA
ncbi:Mu-like prophage major head subunit gpT family protein [Meridianimarinicoccus sp. RP-17]|uniref:Mu-like prophage major head subunit gpT family protein n=1 Tax=Meridianimarinicoccus zhengii TaxID=2056810 RepID=UPI000DADF3FE|nr:Mu-like prophage major head subunit gpT family protein [Phycocomes zhengii]